MQHIMQHMLALREDLGTLELRCDSRDTVYDDGHDR